MSHEKSITIQAAGTLKRYVAPGVTIHNVHTVGEAVTRLTLPEEAGQLTLLVNGRLAYWQTKLDDGDILKLIPGIKGE